MEMFKPTRVSRIVFAVVMSGAAALMLAACKGNGPAAPAGSEISAVQEETTDQAAFSEILGKAGAEKSGIFDLVRGDTEFWLVYQFYTPEAKDIDDDIGMDLGPKIQALYKKFKTLDRIHFVVDVFYAGSSVDWKPYCSFVMTRKVFNETDWANLLSGELFRVVLELKHVG
jgi:hypothetical protein